MSSARRVAAQFSCSGDLMWTLRLFITGTIVILEMNSFRAVRLVQGQVGEAEMFALQGWKSRMQISLVIPEFIHQSAVQEGAKWWMTDDTPEDDWISNGSFHCLFWGSFPLCLKSNCTYVSWIRFCLAMCWIWEFFLVSIKQDEWKVPNTP